jgi:uncharacterized OB-fold protein
MAITHCPDCGEQISSMQEACPNCGHPLNPDVNRMERKTHRKPAALLAGIVVLALSGAGFAAGAKTVSALVFVAGLVIFLYGGFGGKWSDV